MRIMTIRKLRMIFVLKDKERKVVIVSLSYFTLLSNTYHGKIPLSLYTISNRYKATI
jgi:hypothetical protein